MAERLTGAARVRGMVTRRIARLRRYLWQRRNLDSSQRKRPLFLVGCQRSGTNMFHRVVGSSQLAFVYNEDARRAFRNYRLREAATIDRLIEKCPAPVVFFKPLCDSQWVDEILDTHAGSKAIWMYRHYPDVVNSMIRHWGAHQKDTIRNISEGAWEALGWRGERLSAESRELVRTLYRGDLTAHEGGVLVWCLRNRFFFELGLQHDRRVIIVKYEYLVRSPERLFPPIFEFMGTPFEPEFARDVSTRSIHKETFPTISPEIRQLADEMMDRLDAAYAACRIFTD